MKLVSFDGGAGARLGALVDDRVLDLAGAAGGGAAAQMADALAFVQGGRGALDAARRAVEGAPAGAWRPLGEVRLLAPITNPRKILALAGNYQEHVRESTVPVVAKERQVPSVFMKPPTCIVGPDDAVRMPGPICTSVDYEAELGVVIGVGGKDIPAERALDHVFGYFNFNDISGRKLNIEVERDITPRTGYFDWLNGKWFDTFAPIGPWIALADEIPDPQALDLELRVNGEVRQRASTGDMIFSVAETIAWISTFLTFEPGDLIATGTPSGVGSASGRLLKPGDVVEMTIAGLGTLRNPVAE